MPDNALVPLGDVVDRELERLEAHADAHDLAVGTQHLKRLLEGDV